MITRLIWLCLIAAASYSLQASAQSVDLSGVWNRVGGGGGFGGWSWSEEPPPMTAWAQERFDASRPTFGPRGFPASQSNDPVYECYPPGVPRVYFHPFPFEIIQLPERILMMFEYHHQNRQIYTDGRAHRDNLPPLWLGDSIGRWDGETLVIESVNFNDLTWLDRRGVPHSDQLKVTERMHIRDDGVLQIDFSIEDPVALTDPWIGQRLYERVDWPIEEFACMERNRGNAFTELETSILEYGQDAEQ